MRKITPPQARYLARAIAIQDQAEHMFSDGGTGVYFSLWVPGNTNTARALLRRGMLAPRWPYYVTNDGRAALEAFKKRQQGGGS